MIKYSLSHEDMPEPKIAALMYLTENKNVDKVKDTPSSSFIRNTPFHKTSMVYFTEIYYTKL